jgi:glycosyltransferase involved in cell wall biosynthesis
VARRTPERPLRVGFELTVCELDRGGTARAARSLLDALQRREGLELVPLAHPGRPRDRVARGLARELTWLPLRLPHEARRRGLDLLHCPGPVVPARSPVPLVVTIFDALPWRHPEWLTRANVASHRLLVRRAVRRAAAVVTASEHASGEVQAAYGLAADRVHVVPLGVSPLFSPGEAGGAELSRLGAARPYVLAVGTLQPRKNLAAALQAFERLAEDDVELSLVVAGGRGWGERALADRLAASPFRERVRLVGPVADGDLRTLYRGAECFVFPSRYEGFGLPVLEAMACGTPVVCSDRTSIPEVAGDAAVLVSPDSVDEIEAAVRRVRSSETLRRELRERGLRRAAAFTWDRAADRIAGVYRQAVAGAGS